MYTLTINELDAFLIRAAGRITLARIGKADFSAYSGRNVLREVATEINRRISALTSHPSPTEAAGRSELPMLRTMAADAGRLLAVFDTLCPVV